MEIDREDRHTLPTNQKHNLTPTNSLKSNIVVASYQFRLESLEQLLLFVDSFHRHTAGESIEDTAELCLQEKGQVVLVTLLENYTTSAC